MGNILNHNRNIFEIYLPKEDYWDFHLSIDTGFGDLSDGLTERCLSAYIEISDEECVRFDEIYSKSGYVWDKAVSAEGFSLVNFGYTSVDNGRTHYEKDRITNREFFDLFTGTVFTPDEGDMRLSLEKVRGNHQLYDYTNDIVEWNGRFNAARLNGGWFQGFFCANDGTEYKTLPTDIGDGWNLEFVLNKEEFTNDRETLNDVYPENKGIFFYIGTRAENKWWVKYLTDHEFDWCPRTTFADSYAEGEYSESDGLNDHYFKRMVDMYEMSEYFSDEYLQMEKENIESAFSCEYMKDAEPCENCGDYAEEGYIERDLQIDEDMDILTSTGYSMYQPNIVEFTTDNKFLIFDRTCKGRRANEWSEEDEFVMNYIRKPDIGNYFLLFHRGCDGYDTKKVQQVLDVRNKEYDVLKDIYRNAFALQIKDDGSIGYKYMVKDCDSDDERYKIESEFTKVPVIHEKTWHTVNVKIVPLKSFMRYSRCVTQTSSSERMRVMVYVDGRLVLISRELPMLNLRMLDDLAEKQEGVPFSISLGGGSQGLAEVVYLNYMKLPQYRLPIEKEFAGSFIGWLKTFRFYTCPLNYTEIVKNYNFNKTFDIY